MIQNSNQINKGSKFYNRSMKSFFFLNHLSNYIGKYSTYNEGKSVIAEGFIRTLKNKIYKYITLISKN